MGSAEPVLTVGEINGTFSFLKTWVEKLCFSTVQMIVSRTRVKTRRNSGLYFFADLLLLEFLLVFTLGEMGRFSAIASNLALKTLIKSFLDARHFPHCASNNCFIFFLLWLREMGSAEPIFTAGEIFCKHTKRAKCNKIHSALK